MRVITISCLPVAGRENPFQYLMIEGLNACDGIEAQSGINDRFFGVWKTASRQKPDYMHFDWIEGMYARKNLLLMLLNIPVFLFQLWFAQRVAGIQIVSTLHNLEPHNAKRNYLHRYVYRRMLKRCKWIRVFSATTTRHAANLYRIPENTFKVYPEGSFTGYYENTVSSKDARAALGIPENKKVILFFGNLRPYKGIEFLIDAFNRADRKDTMLVIAGKNMDAAYVSKLRSGLPANCILTDSFIPEKKAQIYFNAADIVVLPFTSIENSGSAILAMGFGKVVVAPATGVLPERLSEQPEFLYTDGELLLTLNKALSLSATELQLIGSRNKEALQKYQWEDFGELFIDAVNTKK